MIHFCYFNTRKCKANFIHIKKEHSLCAFTHKQQWLISSHRTPLVSLPNLHLASWMGFLFTLPVCKWDISEPAESVVGASDQTSNHKLEMFVHWAGQSCDNPNMRRCIWHGQVLNNCVRDSKQGHFLESNPLTAQETLMEVRSKCNPPSVTPGHEQSLFAKLSKPTQTASNQSAQNM